MTKPMPSPYGTNRERLFLPSQGPLAAYDAAAGLGDEPADAACLMSDDGSPVADSAQAHRMMAAAIDRLSASDMAVLIEMLRSADLLSKSEAREITEAISGGGSEMASDASVMANRRRQVAAGQRPVSDLHRPIYRDRELSEADKARHREWFPNADRLDRRSFDERFNTSRIKIAR